MTRSVTLTRLTKPGTYGERVTSTVRFYRLTPTMVALRHSLATALGYVIRNPCSLGGGGGFDCYESVELRNGSANHHHVHDTTRHLALDGKPVPEGVKVLAWPDDVEKAAWAIDRGVGTEEKEAA